MGLQLSAGQLEPGNSCQFDVGFEVPVDMYAGSFELSTDPIRGSLDGSPVSADGATATLVVVAAPLAFAAEFLDDPAGPLDTVTLEFNEKTSPGKFTLGENYVYVVMPITIDT